MSIYEGAEVALVGDWIAAMLLADPEIADLSGGIIHDSFIRVADGDPAPEPPHFVYQVQSPSDVRVVGNHRLLVDCIAVVKTIAPVASFTELAPLSGKIDRALTTTPGRLPVQIPGGQIINCARFETVMLVEPDDGEEFRHLGGFYRIQAQADPA